jgi:tetratricopeptide (TPR) repeat protein
VAELAAKDPKAKLLQARAHIARLEWEQAAKCYAEGMEIEPTDDADVWFEYAATQLLAGDRPGYRRACAHMLARFQPAGPMRPYTVARACTLAPDSTDNAMQPLQLARDELNYRNTVYWAHTENAALYFRTGNPEATVTLSEASLSADGRTGRALLNWLWLALAHQKLGKTDEARRCLDRATSWLDEQGDRMPIELPLRGPPFMGLHLHNWLEAQVLRREAEALVR